MSSHQWSNGQRSVDFASRSFFIDDVVATRDALLSQEDTNRSSRITIVDKGPQSFALVDKDTGTKCSVEGYYHLSNLLQELSLAQDEGRKSFTLLGAQICENPVRRILRRIDDTFWASLTRTIGGHTSHNAFRDSKTDTFNSFPRIYIPSGTPEQHKFYTEYSEQHPELHLEVEYLPDDFLDQRTLRILRTRPGILALAVQHCGSTVVPLEYVVPGGRFNEMYGWDTYFISIGLLEARKFDLVQSMIRHWTFQIRHYGCILNSNRTYHLGRSQPPFLTDLLIRVYLAMEGSVDRKSFLHRGILTAIQEYSTVWNSPRRLDQETGLSKYNPGNHGIPPECEDGHFDWKLSPVARRMGITVTTLYEGYVNGTIECPELDEFFSHDWAVRESGHDTSYRLEGRAADLATVDLNCLLYKYERDIAWAIQTVFNDNLDTSQLQLPQSIDGSMAGRAHYWSTCAEKRKAAINKYLWDPASHIFRDYDTIRKHRTSYNSITAFWALWSGIATKLQARQMINEALPLFENVGGATATTQQRGKPGEPELRQRQWDYPFGWAPHQIMLWDGLQKYGYYVDAARLAYKWLYLITKLAVEHNGIITERYDVTSLGVGKDAEYGNQGNDFGSVPMEGFGWTNASYVYGLRMIGDSLRSKLEDGVPWENVEVGSTE